MRRRSVALVRVSGLLLVLAVTEGSAAQVPFTFEFRPSDRISVHTIIESRSDLVFVGVPELPESTAVETTSLAGITRRTLANDGGGFAVRLAFDSVSARYRIGSSAWRDFALPWTGGLWVDFLADRRMALSDPVGSNDSTAVSVVSGAAGAPHLVLPEAAVEVGSRWSSDITLPFAMEIPIEDPATISVALSAPTTGKLDSLIARGADTLAFLSLSGRFLPATVATTYQLGGAPAPVEVWGEFAGRLVWSTGWNAFVSGVLVARINQRLEAAPGSGVEDARITATLTTRVRVRP